MNGLEEMYAEAFAWSEMNELKLLVALNQIVEGSNFTLKLKANNKIA